MSIDTLLGIFIPFLGTSAGSACVFFMKKELSRTAQLAVTLYNIPEGMVVGVVYAGYVMRRFPACLNPCFTVSAERTWRNPYVQ